MPSDTATAMAQSLASVKRELSEPDSGRRAAGPAAAVPPPAKRMRASAPFSPAASPSASTQQLRPIANVATLGPNVQAKDARHLQLLVECEWSRPDLRAKERQTSYYGKTPHKGCDDFEQHSAASRSLVFAARSSMFHLAKTILAAFGLDEGRSFEPDDNQGQLGVAKGTCISLADVVTSANGKLLGVGERPIGGIKYKDVDVCGVTSTVLKKIKVGQVLDAPIAAKTISKSTGWRMPPVVTERAGLRNTFTLQLQPARPDSPWYAFTVRLEAFASRKACSRFPCQHIVPRCFDAKGGVVGGNTLNFENPYLTWYGTAGPLLDEPGVMDVIKLNQKFRAHRPMQSVLDGLIMGPDPLAMETVLAYHASLCEPLLNILRGDCDVAQQLGVACTADEVMAVGRYIPPDQMQAQKEVGGTHVSRN
jgi:hypothetical protein